MSHFSPKFTPLERSQRQNSNAIQMGEKGVRMLKIWLVKGWSNFGQRPSKRKIFEPSTIGQSQHQIEGLVESFLKMFISSKSELIRKSCA